MTHYVDGFVVPVPLRNLDAYRRMALQAGRIWMDRCSFPRRGADEGDALIALRWTQ